MERDEYKAKSICWNQKSKRFKDWTRSRRCCLPKNNAKFKTVRISEQSVDDIDMSLAYFP